MCTVARTRTLEAWKASGELPPEVCKGIRELRRESLERGVARVFDPGVDLEEIRGHLGSLGASDPGLTDKRLYAQITAGRKARAYLPRLPPEAEWAWSRWQALGRGEHGGAWRSELLAEFAMWPGLPPELKREHAGYVEAIDAGVQEYAAAIRGQVDDEMIDARLKSKGGGR